MKYIEKSLSQTAHATIPTLSSTPWKDILQSKPVYAIIVANCCRSYNFYMLVLYQTTFFKEAFKMDMAEGGTLGAVPHLLMTILVPFGGMLADNLRKTGKMTTTNVR